jgi:membrane protein required for beta-lactamase induction
MKHSRTTNRAAWLTAALIGNEERRFREWMHATAPFGGNCIAPHPMFGGNCIAVEEHRRISNSKNKKSGNALAAQHHSPSPILIY